MTKQELNKVFWDTYNKVVYKDEFIGIIIHDDKEAGDYRIVASNGKHIGFINEHCKQRIINHLNGMSHAKNGSKHAFFLQEQTELEIDKVYTLGEVKEFCGLFNLDYQKDALDNILVYQIGDYVLVSHELKC